MFVDRDIGKLTTTLDRKRVFLTFDGFFSYYFSYFILLCFILFCFILFYFFIFYFILYLFIFLF